MQLYTHMHPSNVQLHILYTVDSQPVVHALAVKHSLYLQKTKTPKIRNKDGYQDCQMTDNNIILF
jgi:hypothetical protein